MNKQTVVFLMAALISASSTDNYYNFYCASNCADYMRACAGTTLDDCAACYDKIFYGKSDNGTCILRPQFEVEVEELRNEDIDLSGYKTNFPVPAHCGVYGLSGRYTAGAYLAKTFTGFSANHYGLSIRFGVGYIGSWRNTDQMAVSVNGVTYSWSYYCATPADICSGYPIDCFKIIEIDVNHNGPNLSINFTSTITETDPIAQYWGIKDLVIIAKNCFERCATCHGPEFLDCTSCLAGFYLLDNTCVIQCSDYTIQDERKCAKNCPIRYYSDSSKFCFPCQRGCMVCKNETNCEIWDARQQTLWEKHLVAWIVLIFMGFLLIIYGFWRCLIKKYVDKAMKDLHEDQEIVQGEPTESLQKKIISKEPSLDEQTINNNEGPKIRQKFSNNFISEQKIETGHESSCHKIVDSSSIWMESITSQTAAVKAEEQNRRRKRQKGRGRRKIKNLQGLEDQFEEVDVVDIVNVANIGELPSLYQNQRL